MMVFCVITVWFLINCFSGIQSIESDGDPVRQERLLLNDPQAISAQLLTFQRKLDELSAKIVSMESEKSQLKSEIVTIKSENSRQNSDILTIKSENSRQNSDILTIKSENSQLKSEVLAMKTEISVIMNGGTVYIRWGRKDCPNLNGTQLVYSGIAGGASYTEVGGGANTLCLPHDPDNSKRDFPDSLLGSTSVAHVYGAEYQYNYHNTKIDDDVPCAVCVDIKGTASIMIPGKTSCPTEWRKQYNGHVCSGHYGHNGPTDYTCVDDDSQYFEGRRNDNNGRLFYPVVTVCGSLPCPPYENSKYLKCVVCTK